MENKKYYIAYGSNLNLPQMAERCPTARVIGASRMNDSRLLFRGPHGGAVATVEPCKGSSVPVLVWEITEADEEALDRYEGWPYLYRKEMVKIKLGRKTIDALVYLMNEGKPLNQPSSYYYSVIYDGYKSAGFDIEMLKKATTDSLEGEDDNDR